MRRIYVSNVRLQPLLLVNTAYNIEVIDVRGDYTDVQPIPANNVTVKGASWTYTTTGQTSCYGRHWENTYISTTAGNLIIACNEPLDATLNQVEQSFSGTSGWTAVGGLILSNVNDYVIWEMPYYMIGITSFSNIAPVITGVNTGNITLTFQYDIGTGYNGTWLTLNATNLSTIAGIISTTGVKLKVRAVCSIASTTNELRYIKIQYDANTTQQALQYPLPGIPVSLTNLIPGSEIRAFVGIDPATVIEIAGVENSTTIFDFTHNNIGQDGYVIVFALGYIPLTIPITYSSSSVSIPIQQVIDRVYA